MYGNRIIITKISIKNKRIRFLFNIIRLIKIWIEDKFMDYYIISETFEKWTIFNIYIKNIPIYIKSE